MMKPFIEGYRSTHETPHETHHIMHRSSFDVTISQDPSSRAESNHLPYYPGLCQRLSQIGLCYRRLDAYNTLVRCTYFSIDMLLMFRYF